MCSAIVVRLKLGMRLEGSFLTSTIVSLMAPSGFEPLFGLLLFDSEVDLDELAHLVFSSALAARFILSVARAFWMMELLGLIFMKSKLACSVVDYRSDVFRSVGVYRCTNPRCSLLQVLTNAFSDSGRCSFVKQITCKVTHMCYMSFAS